MLTIFFSFLVSNNGAAGDQDPEDAITQEHHSTNGDGRGEKKLVTPHFPAVR